MLRINKMVIEIGKALILFNIVVELSKDLSAALAHHHPR